MNEIDIVVDFPLLISRWLHFASFTMVLGGAAFMRLALLPGAGESLDSDQRDKLNESVRRRWGKFVHAAIAVLVLTGLFNFYTLAIRPGVEPMPYHALFGVKILVALGVFFIAQALVGRSAAFAGIRLNNGKWLALLLTLGAMIILLSGLLSQVRQAVSSSNLPTSTATQHVPAGAPALPPMRSSPTT